MRKAHAHRHRRQATRTREAERARRIQVAIEAEERRRAEEDARWARERHRFWGMPFTPVAGMTMAQAAAVRARADACREPLLLDAQLGLAYVPAGCTEISFTAPAISGKL